MEIPLFIRNFGYEIISYILNISDDEAKMVLENKFELSSIQLETIKAYVEIFKAIKIKNIEQEDSKMIIVTYLSGCIMNEKHIFNIYRERNGGFIPKFESSNIIESLVLKLSIEIYPLFLLKKDDKNLNDIGLQNGINSIFYSFPSVEVLQNEIINDKDFKRLFSENSAIGVSIRFNNSTGRMTTIQLSLFPQVLISKIYELMVLKRAITIDNLHKYTKLVIQMYRELAITKQLKTPIILGFENVALPNDTKLVNDYGIIKGYSKVFYDRLPTYIKPSTFNSPDTYLGFTLETEFNYEIEVINDEERDFNFSEKFKGYHDEINHIKNNLELAFTLSSDKNITGIKHKWTIIFDILSFGSSPSWNNRGFNSNPIEYSSDELEEVSNWYQIINDSDDSSIQLAIRRILSAVNVRSDPLDSFVDSIIALENIFGGKTEISFRVSMSIAVLLENDIEKRVKLQDEINKLYNYRSRILHGDNKTIQYEEIVKKRNRSLEITIACLKKLYLNSDLLKAKDRSKTILLTYS